VADHDAPAETPTAASKKAAHWERIYATKGEREVSWFEETPVALALFEAAKVSPTATVIDIGGGASRLPDALLMRGAAGVTVLDISARALANLAARLANEPRPRLIAADVTRWVAQSRYDVWHDRAAFHFLTGAEDQAAYVAAMRRALPPGGIAIIGTFAPDGPEKCSGQPVARHDAASLAAIFGPGFDLLASRRHDHRTPWDTIQHFQFSTFRRR
jgi:SAM-dependent methyltransferase